MTHSSSGKVQGTVAPGFESVLKLYTHRMETMAEDHSQLCVYHRGEKVVDLWYSKTPEDQFNADSLINVFSSGKSLEAIAIASLVDRGLLAYDAKIIEYWPEFGSGGKAGLTVADLMRHEAGLANLNTSLKLDDALTENIKQNAVGRILESHPARFPDHGDGPREYHAITRGWIANELFRRVDPQGRTIGEYLKEDIARPMDVDVIVGVDSENMQRRYPVKPLGFGFQFLESMRPRILGRRIVHNIFQLLGRVIRLIPYIRKAAKAGHPPSFEGMQDLHFFNKTSWSQGETPSANATCSARGLAKVAAMMAAGGSWEGKTYIGTGAWQALHDHPLKASMGGMLITRFTQGGIDSFTPCTPESTRGEREFNQGREGFFGWMGLGGSIFQWHPEEDIGFAFVPSTLHVLDFFNERGKDFQAEVLKCVASRPRIDTATENI